MKLTDEQIEQILVEAPNRAVFFDGDDYSDINGLVWDKRREEYVDCGHYVCGDSLDLYREILTLRQRVQELEDLNQAVVEQSPEVEKLVKALEEMIYVANMVDNWESFPFYPIERAEDAIRAYRKQGGEL